MEPGPACWMILSFLSRRGGKASAWILSKNSRKAGEGEERKVPSHVRSGDFLSKSLIYDIPVPATTTGELYPG